MKLSQYRILLAVCLGAIGQPSWLSAQIRGVAGIAGHGQKLTIFEVCKSVTRLIYSGKVIPILPSQICPKAGRKDK